MKYTEKSMNEFITQKAEEASERAKGYFMNMFGSLPKEEQLMWDKFKEELSELSFQEGMWIGEEEATQILNDEVFISFCIDEGEDVVEAVSDKMYGKILSKGGKIINDLYKNG